MTDLRYDAVIIGGGPAGCSAAITLAKQGWRTALLEAKTFPHHKVCGEFLSPECTALLDQLGMLSQLYALNPVQIQTSSLTAPDGTQWKAQLPGSALGVSRSALDHVMAVHAQSCGVHLYQATTATAINGSLTAGFEVQARTRLSERKFAARAVIAAHGKRSNLDRALKRRFLKRQQSYIGLKAHFNGPPLPGLVALNAFPGGYCGISEIEGGAFNVCLLAQKSAFQQHSTNGIRSFIEWMQTENPYLDAWLSQAERISGQWLSIGEVPFVPKRPIVNDVLMVGDAAGLIAPLAGDGIAIALHSGLIAAAHSNRYLAGDINHIKLCHTYENEWRARFRMRLRLSWVLQPLMFHPRAASAALQTMLRLPALGDFLVRQTRDMRLIET